LFNFSVISKFLYIFSNKIIEISLHLPYNEHMKKRNKLLSFLLLIVGVAAVCFGCVELIKQVEDFRQTAQKPSSPIQSETQASSAENPDNETVQAGISSDSAGARDETSSNPSSDARESSEYIDSSEIAASSEALDSSASVTTEAEKSEEVLESTPEGNVDSTETPYLSPYADYFVQYPDMAAWLCIPDTVIDYPVMWTPGDETYYLYRHYDGTDNQNGSLLLDTDSSLSPLTTNLIIHGHDMRSGAMFGNLTDYADQNYCEQHKEMLLYTEDCERHYEVISVFYSQVYKKKDTVFKFYKFFQADTEAEFYDFYDNIKRLSLFDTGVTAEFGDRFITLSTCSSHVTNGRFVVVAKEITDTNITE